jgi:hypothetical protein
LPHPIILACITPFYNMRPPLIYSRLPHFHNHGLAISSENKFLKSVFLLVYHQNPPSPQRDGALKKREGKSIEKKDQGKEKLQESLQIKREVNILRGEKHFNFKIFLHESILSPSIIPFSKPFPKSFEKVSSHPLTWQYT